MFYYHHGKQMLFISASRCVFMMSRIQEQQLAVSVLVGRNPAAGLALLWISKPGISL